MVDDTTDDLYRRVVLPKTPVIPLPEHLVAK